MVPGRGFEPRRASPADVPYTGPIRRDSRHLKVATAPCRSPVYLESAAFPGSATPARYKYIIKQEYKNFSIKHTKKPIQDESIIPGTPPHFIGSDYPIRFCDYDTWIQLRQIKSTQEWNFLSSDIIIHCFPSSTRAAWKKQ